MDYKNYRLCYHSGLDNIGIIVFDDDMSKYTFNTAEEEVSHIVQMFLVPAYKVENYKYHLDENGLLFGVFPPNFIEDCFKEEKQIILERENQIKKSIIESSKKPLDEEFFIRKKKQKVSLERILRIIENKNKSNLYHGGYEFSIEKYYKDILIKYWGNYRL